MDAQPRVSADRRQPPVIPDAIRRPSDAALNRGRLAAPITKIQYLLANASIVTTERYIHHTLAELAKAAAVLEDGGVFDPSTAPTVGKGISPGSQGSETSKPDVH